jgi:hypothetical protein
MDTESNEPGGKRESASRATLGISRMYESIVSTYRAVRNISFEWEIAQR